jgi:2-polyprenyl-6-methoxyphenol hydroxylase-like FAD-dependent oxidoreductase
VGSTVGTGTAVVAAHMVAGELAAADGDRRTAFPAYERRLRRYAQECQKGGDRAGAFLAPRTARGIRMRKRLLGVPILLNLMIALGKRVTSLSALPDYPSSIAPAMAVSV